VDAPARGGRVPAGALAVSAVLVTVSLALALHAPDPAARGELARWLDTLAENSLPTWWSTALLLVVALAHAAAGAAARVAGVPAAGAWLASAAVVAAFSLTEVSGTHRRLAGAGRLVFGDGPVTASWLPPAAALALPVAGVLVAVAARLGPCSGRPLATGGVLLLACAVGGEFAAALLGGRSGPEPAPVLVAHLSEFGENVGAVLMLVAASHAVVATRGAALGLRYRGAGTGGGPCRVSTTPVWRWLVGVTAALSLLSLAFVLTQSAHGPALREVRLHADVLIEHNLPTWWSVALLTAAALAHAATGRTARLAGAPDAASWYVTAAVLAGLSLDDQSQLHERTEELGRLLVTERGDFPFYWLLPGATAGLAVVAAVAVLAARVHGRARALLVAGVAVLLGCALGLEVVQGMFMAVGNEGLAFALGYHVEELGENVAALLLLGSAAAATRVTAEDGGLALRYTGRRDRARTAARSPVTAK
jgi:hypothetical protein